MKFSTKLLKANTGLFDITIFYGDEIIHELFDFSTKHGAIKAATVFITTSRIDHITAINSIVYKAGIVYTG